jgi:uncharacterized membrane protein
MGININFQMKETLQFLEKRMQKLRRKKIIFAGFSLIIPSLLCYYFLSKSTIVCLSCIIGGYMILYPTACIINNKLFQHFHK